MQTSYSTAPGSAVAGMKADAGIQDVISRTAATRQLELVTIVTAANSEKYSVTINGTKYEITSDASATKTEIRDALKTAIEAGAAAALVTVTAITDALEIECKSHDAGITISVTADTPANISLVQLVAQEQAIGFGKVVVWDEKVSGYRSCRLPRLAADVSGHKVWGVALADTSKETRESSPYGGYSAGEQVPCLRKGRVWVTVEDAVTLGGQAYVRHVAGVGEELGAIRSDADTSDATALPGAYFLTSAGAGGLALLGLNL